MTFGQAVAAGVIILGFFAVLFATIVVVALIVEDWSGRLAARRTRRSTWYVSGRPEGPVPLEECRQVRFYRPRNQRPRRTA